MGVQKCLNSFSLKSQQKYCIKNLSIQNWIGKQMSGHKTEAEAEAEAEAEHCPISTLQAFGPQTCGVGMPCLGVRPAAGHRRHHALRLGVHQQLTHDQQHVDGQEDEHGFGDGLVVEETLNGVAYFVGGPPASFGEYKGCGFEENFGAKTLLLIYWEKISQ